MELTVTLNNPEKRAELFGSADANLRILRETCDVHVSARDGQVKLVGATASVQKAALLLDLMQKHLQHNSHITTQTMQLLVHDAASLNARDKEHYIEVYIANKAIAARSAGQEAYIQAISNNDLVFCTGPAGSGKTYLAVAMAVSMLKQRRIRRLVLARPAVEAGEKLGFLPGDLFEKVNPYLRPLFDALGDMMDYAQIKRFMTDDIIEVIPLAFMRGRTLNESAIILDEAQNTTVPQMLMFLTRLGNNSKMIVTGDDSQTDLEDGRKSGLIDAMVRLKETSGIGMIRLEECDIVRHRLVQRIVKAYGTNGNGNNVS